MDTYDEIVDRLNKIIPELVHRNAHIAFIRTERDRFINKGGYRTIVRIALAEDGCLDLSIISTRADTMDFSFDLSDPEVNVESLAFFIIFVVYGIHNNCFNGGYHG